MWWNTVTGYFSLTSARAPLFSEQKLLYTPHNAAVELLSQLL